MSGEPKTLTLTLEELAVLHGILVWKDPTSEAWVAGRIYLTSPHDPARYHQAWEPMGIGATWPEAASKALGVRVVARDDAAELRALLNHPLLNKLMGELEDHSTGRWWGMAEEWMDLRDAALAASEGRGEP